MKIDFFTQTKSEPYPLPNTSIRFTSTTENATNFEWYVETLGGITDDYSVAMKRGYAPTSAVVATTPDFDHIFPD